MRPISVVVGVLLSVTACAGGTTSTDSASDSAAIYAVSLRHLVTDDNSFVGEGNPFSHLLVQSSLDPEAGLGGPAGETRPLSDEERSAIEAALTPLAPTRWIDDPAEWRTDELMPVIEGSAILGVGPITFDDDGALVPMSMWCGGTCGTWFTYRVAQLDDVWTVVDIEGPIAVS